MRTDQIRRLSHETSIVLPDVVCISIGLLIGLPRPAVAQAGGCEAFVYFGSPGGVQGKDVGECRTQEQACASMEYALDQGKKVCSQVVYVTYVARLCRTGWSRGDHRRRLDQELEDSVRRSCRGLAQQRSSAWLARSRRHSTDSSGSQGRRIMTRRLFVAVIAVTLAVGIGGAVFASGTVYFGPKGRTPRLHLLPTYDIAMSQHVSCPKPITISTTSTMSTTDMPDSCDMTGGGGSEPRPRERWNSPAFGPDSDGRLFHGSGRLHPWDTRPGQDRSQPQQ